MTRTLSKAHSLAGFRIGYGIFPGAIADDLNSHNDAYPLARPSQAAAIATLRHEAQIHARAAQLRGWTADLAPHDAAEIADQLRKREIMIKPLHDPALGPGFMRITTALPEDNQRFVDALRTLLT